MCVLIIHCSDKYSCSQSKQPAVEVGASDDEVCDVLVLKQPLSSPLTDADQPGPTHVPCRTGQMLQA